MFSLSKHHFLDQNIQKVINLLLKTEARVEPFVMAKVKYREIHRISPQVHGLEVCGRTPVKLFSKTNNYIFGYFDPTNNFF